MGRDRLFHDILVYGRMPDRRAAVLPGKECPYGINRHQTCHSESFPRTMKNLVYPLFETVT
jgi:hypothetical protein